MNRYYVSGIIKLGLLKLLAITSKLPISLCYFVTDIIAVLAFFVLYQKRISVRNNLICILNKKPTLYDILKVFIEYGRYWAELPRINEIWRKSSKKICGPDFPPVEKRFLGITFHIGNFEIFGSALYPFLKSDLFVVAENLKPEFLADHFSLCRKQHHIQTVFHNDLRRIIKVLKEGNSLGVVCDRMIDGNGVKVRLFGKSVCMPLNIVKFALQNEIPVYVAYCVKESDEYKIHCQKMDVDTDYEDAVKQIALVIENTVRNYPYQWHVLSAI